MTPSQTSRTRSVSVTHAHYIKCIVLKLDDHFKEHEIEVLEASRRCCIMYREYAAKVRENVVQESVRATFNHQWQISQACTAMT